MATKRGASHGNGHDHVDNHREDDHRGDFDNRTMKSVFWEGKPFEMSVKRVPRARVVNDDDAVVRVTTSAICGTDLHVYHGVFGSSQVPYAMGHEAIGIVVEVGNSVDTVKVGDRVIIPDLPDDGHLDIEPTLIENFTVFGLGREFGNLGGCQGKCATRFQYEVATSEAKTDNVKPSSSGYPLPTSLSSLLMTTRFPTTSFCF